MQREDIDDLSKSLLNAFPISYIETFHPDLLDYVDIMLCRTAPNEIRIPNFRHRGRAQRLFSDIVFQMPFNDAGRALFPDYDDFGLAVEPQTGDVADLRDGEVYLEKARTQPIAAALLGFMRLDPERKPAVQAEAILLIDGYDLDFPKKNLLARGLLTGMNLNEADHKRFTEILESYPGFERSESVITTWYDRGARDGETIGFGKGKAVGQTEALQRAAISSIKRRFGSADFAVDKVKNMKTEQLFKLIDDLVDPSMTPNDLGLTNGA